MIHAETTFEGRRIPYVVRRSGRARRLQLRIDDAGRLEVVVPNRWPASFEPDDFIREHGDWVTRHLGAIEARTAERPVVRLEADGQLPLLGRPCPIRVDVEGRRARATYAAGRIDVKIPTDDTDLAPPVERLLRRIAGDVFVARVRFWCDELGHHCRSVRIRDFKSQWGNCSRDGRIALNWRLVLAPAEVLDTVVLHEVVHLRHFGHDESFHAAMDRMSPKRRARDQWLNDYGHTLRLTP